MKKRVYKIVIFLMIIVLLSSATGYYYFIECLNILKFTQVSNETNITLFDKYNNGGEKVKIAILDSGVNLNHRDFSGNIKSGYDFINNQEKISDKYGHGTWITGIIGACDNNIGICGVAPNAEIYPLIVLDDMGKGKISDVVDAIYWCIKENIDIINVSFSTKKNGKNLEKAISEAIKKGIFVVASYDNKKNRSSYPAQYENVIGVKAEKKVDKIYIKEEICYAPGYDIVTTNREGGYEKVNGNSVATAYVTGCVALIVSEYKANKENYDVNIIKKLLVI